MPYVVIAADEWKLVNIKNPERSPEITRAAVPMPEHGRAHAFADISERDARVVDDEDRAERRPGLDARRCAGDGVASAARGLWLVVATEALAASRCYGDKDRRGCGTVVVASTVCRYACWWKNSPRQ